MQQGRASSPRRREAGEEEEEFFVHHYKNDLERRTNLERHDPREARRD